jgi:nucleoside-diphosphate-sugar epimerase
MKTIPDASAEGAVFLTGATGLVGARLLARLVASGATVYCLVRDSRRFEAVSAPLGGLPGRAIPLLGDLRGDGLGLDAPDRRRCARSVRRVIHAAADTCFSRPLPLARAVNTDGTLRVLDLAGDWPLDRLVHVSTAFVAGRHTGSVPEAALTDRPGFVNAYERSKHEAEALVRRSGLPWSIARSSTIVCDDLGGSVTQHNAVHRALRVFHSGLAAMLPGSEEATVDLVTTEHVIDGILRIADRGESGSTYHLCAGAGAMPLGELLDRCLRVWSADSVWRRRGIALPAVTDLETYRLFEASVEETGDARLAAITRSLSHFVPQLALPKRFETGAADAILGRSPPRVEHFWEALVARMAEHPGKRRAA